MNTEPTTVEKLRGLRWSIASNAANTIFVQLSFFGSVFILFLSALGLSKSEMGFVLSLLPFSGLIALFIAPAVARFGYKRTYLTFFGSRKVVAAFLLLTPWVLSQFGRETTLTFVTVVVAIFAILRSVAMTASFPWTQEYVPDTVRGKYTAMSNIVTSLTGVVAISVAGYVIGRTSGLSGYMVLIAVGVLFGLFGVWLASFIPGGAPIQRTATERRQQRNLGEALRDRDFRLYLAGVGLISLATIPLGSFLPLFMQEQVGLSSGNVVMLQMGTLLGSLLSSYLWGWAADRYGSKPVMLSGVCLSLLLPVCWVLMPRHSLWSLYVAFGIACLQGLASLGWGIGSARLLYTSVVPPGKKSDYMALYYAWIGIVNGLSKLLGGRVLDYSQGITGQFLIFTLDPYLPLFIAGLMLPLVSILLLRRIRAEETVGVGEFAGIFFRGNPFLAMASMIRYHLAKDEYATILMTERMGQAKSLLTVEELLEALTDPRFNVRFEAIISIARTRPDPRLTEALVQILDGSELALSVIAAWALGRIGDEQAIEPLRRALDSHYRSIQAHSARALGTLGDTATIPLLTGRLARETDKGLQMAYASALGSLRAKEATGQLLSVLERTENEGARMELALSLARIVGDEHQFIQLLRQVRADPGTATSQGITALKGKVDRSQEDSDDLLSAIDECAEALARDDLARGVALMSHIIHLLPMERLEEPPGIILQDCAKRLDEFNATHIEYVLLALHTMQVGSLGRE